MRRVLLINRDEVNDAGMFTANYGNRLDIIFSRHLICTYIVYLIMGVSG